MRTLPITALVGFGILLAGTKTTATDDRRPPRVAFDARIAPILARRCLDCHSGAEPKGKLDLTSQATSMRGGETGAAIAPGKPDESVLWERVASNEMPPRTPLTEAEKTALRDWIASGAGWGTDPIDPYQVTTSRRAGRDWWSLQPVRRPALPEAAQVAWVRTPIDAFVLRKLDEAGLTPAPEADRRTLIRRLSYDLTGLPPTPEDVDAFLGDPEAGAYDRVADRYLASPQYGVRWARWWLDLARYGESDGFEFDQFRPNAWRYRDWVVDALNRDLRYDEFARLQLAGDVLRPDDVGAVEATGFLVAGAYDAVGQNQISEAMKAVVRSDQLEDVVGTVGQTFLGLTIHCARCHDHKFDPIRQVEYYRMASALDGVNPGERDLSGRAPELAGYRSRIAELTARISAIDDPARGRILAGRTLPASPPPTPSAAWDFDRGPADRVGGLEATLHGGATLTRDGLVLDGTTGYATTPPLPRPLTAKTIEVWVQLSDLRQRGGAALSIQAGNGSTFDAIVFGEQEPGRWMAGSEGFRRYRSVAGDEETEASRRPVHLAITYAEDGTIRIFRDGLPHGAAYRPSGPATFPAGETRIAFGLRHPPVGGNRMLAGSVVRARVYDRALEPSEIAASAATFSDFVSQDAIAATLSTGLREERARLIAAIEALRESMASRSHRAYVVAARPAGTMKVQIRGNPQQPGEVVTAGGVSALAAPGADFQLPPDAPEALRRQRLASWIADPRNPLFARVIVNRLWQAHFGTGLVETPNDLGFSGGLPSHPELLDWLASELVSRGWSLKAMHRLIVTSTAYRQSSRFSPEASGRDTNNRLLWRKAPARLEAEMVRDAMLAVSGSLDLRLGGPSFHDQEAVKAPGTPAVLYKALDPGAPGLDRRTLYRAWSRGGRNAFLDAFDCPDPSTTAPRRAVTTTPLQALSMLNNALVLHLSDILGARLIREAGSDARRQVERAYRLAFGRDPDPDERAAAIRIVERFGTPTLARAIFNSNEFLYVD
jgi:hypothetical protein